MSTRILVVPANTDQNRGDQALTWESIRLAEDAYKDCEVIICYSGDFNRSMANSNYQTKLLGYKFIRRILDHPRRDRNDLDIQRNLKSFLIWSLRAIKDFFMSLLLLSSVKLINKLGFKLLTKEKREAYNVIKGIDAVFVKGGGFMHSYGKIADWYIMYYQLFEVLLATKLKKQIFVLPNSIGPLEGPFVRNVIKKAFGNAAFIAVRESVSQKYLLTNGLGSKIYPDLAFYLKSKSRINDKFKSDESATVGNDVKRVAITLRPYRFDSSYGRRNLYSVYLDNFEKIINSLTSMNHKVTLVAHTLGPSKHENDRIALEEVYSRVNQNPRVEYFVDEKMDCKDIQEYYASFDLVIGTRFHSVVFAMNVLTPAIAISYGGNKGKGIMNDMGLEKYVVPIENPDVNRIMMLVEDIFQNRDMIINKILAYKSTVEKQRESLIKELEISVKK